MHTVDSLNARIDVRVGEIMNALSSCRQQVRDLTERWSPLTSYRWYETLPPDHPLQVRIRELEAQLDDLQRQRPSHPSLIPDITGRVSQAVIDLICGHMDDL